jgi:hypothetical protein
MLDVVVFVQQNNFRLIPDQFLLGKESVRGNNNKIADQSLAGGRTV